MDENDLPEDQYQATLDPIKMMEQVKIQNEQAIQAIQALACLRTGADFKARRMYIMGEINDELVYHFLVPFQIMDESPGDIIIFMHSNGGSEDAGYAIYDAIAHSKNKVEIVGIGGVYSIAAIIFQAGAVRSLYPEARFMIHNGSIEIEANIAQDSVVALGKEFEKGNEKYQGILSRRSGKTSAQIRVLCEAETFFNAEETVKNGFADRVLDRAHPAPKKRKKK